MRPRREPGVGGTDPGREPGVSGSWLVVDPGLAPGVSGSGFTEIFRIDVRPLLHAHRVQRDAPREPGHDALPQVHPHPLPPPPPPPRTHLAYRRAAPLPIRT